MADREPPHNIEAERTVLGTIMLDARALDDVCLIVGSDPMAFYSQDHQKVYAAMLELAANQQPVEPAALYRKVPNAGLLAELSGISSLSHIEYYAKQVSDAAMMRALADAAREIYAEAMANESAPDVLDAAERRLFQISERRNHANSVTRISNILPGVVKNLRDLGRGEIDATGVPSGLHLLDQLLGGLQDNDLIILSARPSVGKSALALQISRHASMRVNTNVLFFSLEMAKHQLVERMIAAEGVNIRDIKGQVHVASNLTLLDAASKRLTPIPMFLDDSASATMYEIRSKARRHQAKYGKSLIVVDYLQLMRIGGNQRRDKRYIEIGEMTKGLKALARELVCPVLCLCQLGRGSEDESDGFRLMGYLRESGDIEADADVIIILTRLSGKDADAYNEQYGKHPDDRPSDSAVKAWVVKQRNGPTGVVNLYFDKPMQRFRILDKPAPATQDPIPTSSYTKEDAPFDEFGPAKDDKDDEDDEDDQEELF